VDPFHVDREDRAETPASASSAKAPERPCGRELAFQRPPVEYVPTGDFALSIMDLAHLSVQTSWREGKRQRLEGCLNDFVASLYLVAEAIKAHRIEQERRRREAEEEQKRRWEEQRRQEEEAKRAKGLEEVVGHWRFTYHYDFGDDWEHDVHVERILEAAAGPIIHCIDGGRACPPEDCGGPLGYQRMLEVLANPKDEEHANMKRWVGKRYDAEAFNVAVVNKKLVQLAKKRVRGR
jgi:hypothetical protein